MRAIVQRVSEAEVSVDGREITGIGTGLLVLVGFRKGDGADQIAPFARKLAGLRVFADDAGRMNRDVREVGGQILLVPNFTLYGDTRRGRRPGFDGAADPEAAAALFDALATAVAAAGAPVETGRFGAHMHVSLVNDGPVTLILDSDDR